MNQAKKLDLSQSWSSDQWAQYREIESQIIQGHLEAVRFAFADQHGIVRGKTILAPYVLDALRNGVNLVSTILLKDTSHHTTYPVFQKNAGMGSSPLGGSFSGGGDIVLSADLLTYRRLPWVDKTGWILCNALDVEGVVSPVCTRSLYQRSLKVLETQGYEFVAGLEVEFYLFKVDDPQLQLSDAGWPGSPPKTSLLNNGYQHLTEQRIDQLHAPLALIQTTMQGLGLPLSSIEIELGPSQVECVFAPQIGIAPADAMILFRNAVKQVMRRHGYHASFMCRPKIPQVMSSGWHLHQSLRLKESGTNAFAPNSLTTSSASGLSQVGEHFLAGLLEHAQASIVFAAPTINAYRRYRPHSLAPDRVSWGRDNRGVMLRVVGQEEASRIENRVGEPAANPYLYFASQIFGGLDGIARGLVPQESADMTASMATLSATPSAQSVYDSGAVLPKSLFSALHALEQDEYMRQTFGSTFIDYFVNIKRFELARFESEVTEWEQREYFDMF